MRMDPSTVGRPQNGPQALAQQAWAKSAAANAVHRGDTEFAGDQLSHSLLKWKTWFRKINQQNGYKGTKKYTIANFMFLLIIAGTEMDMAGLFISAPIYLSYDPFYEILLVFVIIGFFLPLIFATMKPFIGMCFGSQGESQIDKFFSNMVPQELQAGGGEGQGFLSKFLTRVNPHGGDMQLYHWVPGVRFYLVVKPNYSPSDVDALFRVNSISTFTFGIFQVIGVMATAVANRPFDLYVKINIGTQILNWLITILYFGSNISVWMGTAGSVRAVQNHYRGIATEYSRLGAVNMEGMMDGSEQATITQGKIDRMEEALAELLERAYFGRAMQEDAKKAKRASASKKDSDSEAEVTEEEREALAAKLAEEGAIAATHMKTARKMFRQDMSKMRPIDVRVFIDVLKEQSVTCLG